MLKDPRNLLIPFRRDKKSDFANGSGAILLKSKITQALATEGEMPWNTAMDSGLNRLRHQNNSDVLTELARVYVQETLAKWVPEVEVLAVSAKRDGAALLLTVSYRSRTPSAASSGEVTLAY